MINVYKQNRLDLYNKIEDNSLVILYSGALKQMSADENYPFVVNTNFFYLTGIKQDNTYLVLSKIKGEVKETIFAYENTEFHSKWFGEYLTPEMILETSDVDEVIFVHEFDKWLNKTLRNKIIRRVYIDLEESQFAGQIDFGYMLKNKVNAYSFDKKVIDCYNIITKLRGVKKPYEIEIFKYADQVTKLALEEVMKKLPTLEYEYQAQALFEQQIKHIANAGVSFETIAAAGKNAAVLHYRANDAKMNQNDMILLDLGAQYGMYHADITRTYPINGHYGEKELMIYNIVLGCNKYIISEIKPGVSIMDLQKKTIEFLAQGCLDNGLIKEKEEIKNYYFHGISHHIGLDTHDPYPRDDRMLVPGMIISCEPGLYFKDLGIGVRIEDDILVTETGSENLSKDIIKEPHEIEEFMAKYIQK